MCLALFSAQWNTSEQRSLPWRGLYSIRSRHKKLTDYVNLWEGLKRAWECHMDRAYRNSKPCRLVRTIRKEGDMERGFEPDWLTPQHSGHGLPVWWPDAQEGLGWEQQTRHRSEVDRSVDHGGQWHVEPLHYRRNNGILLTFSKEKKFHLKGNKKNF